MEIQPNLQNIPETKIQKNFVFPSKIGFGNQVVPFSINTPPGSGGFYIKIRQADTNKLYMRIFVNSGTEFSTKVAPGVYKISYATGDRWISTNGKFWPRTYPYILSMIFYFNVTKNVTKDDETYTSFNGHKITLIDQKDGNLPKQSISESDFDE